MSRYCWLGWVLFFLFCDISAAQESVLHFAPLPMENREVVYKQFEPMRAYLQQTTGRKIIFKYSDSYRELLDKFTEGGIDLAYLGPLPYVELRKEDPKATPLVTFREVSGKAGYTCSLISLSDTHLDLSRLKGLKVALTQPLSTCGYLSVNGLLMKHGAGIEKNHYRYLGRHDAVALAVVRSEFDLGGVKTAIARKYEHLGIKILKKTDVMPGFALVANARSIDPDLAETICKAFSTLEPDGKDKEMLSGWGKKISNGAVRTNDEKYEIIRCLMGNSVIPSKGNF